MGGFTAFLVIVLGDAALRDELRQAPDLAALFAMVMARSRERGIELTQEELQAVVNMNHRSWLERWTDR
jgi:hypothetical protein